MDTIEIPCPQYILGGAHSIANSCASPVRSLLRSSISCTTGKVIISSVSEGGVVALIGVKISDVDVGAVELSTWGERKNYVNSLL